MNNVIPHQKIWLGPLPPTPACYPLLSISPCCLLYISEDRVLREEGGGGVEEGNTVTCVYGNGWRIVSIMYVCSVCANLPQ